MSIFEAIIQGIVQGLTEFLPISSSGHLSLLQHFFGISGEASLMFSVFLHFGTLLSVFVAFRKTIFVVIREFFRCIKDLFTGKFTFKNVSPARRMLFLIIVAEIPMLAAYFFKDMFASFSTDKDIIIEGLGFLITATLLFFADRAVKGHKSAKNAKYSDALVVGLFQAVAPVPGISRSGSTISSGLFTGLSKRFAVEFSFIIGVPVVFMANLLEFKDALATPGSIDILPIVLGVSIAAVVGLLAIKMVRYIVQSDKFKWFYVYTAILGVVVLMIGIIEKF